MANTSKRSNFINAQCKRRHGTCHQILRTSNQALMKYHNADLALVECGLEADGKAGVVRGALDTNDRFQMER